MNDLYELLKQKLERMRSLQRDYIELDYHEISQLYQFICFMKQVKELVNWGEKDG